MTKRYRLKQGLEKRTFSFGNTLYFLDDKTYREYPENLISYFLPWLDAEPKAKKEPEPIMTETINDKEE